MKVVITITDNAATPGKCSVEFDFDPPIDQDDQGDTPASRLALNILQGMADDIKSGAINDVDES